MKWNVTPLSAIAAAILLCACQQSLPEKPTAAAPAAKEETSPTPPPDATPGEIVANGTFLGRSGKPMKNARLFLAEVVAAGDFQQALVKLVADVETAVADAEGKFRFRNFEPGVYTIVYQPAGASRLVPQELRIKTLSASTNSIAPGLTGIVLGTDRELSPRPWGKRFVLLKGHTLDTLGKSMRIRNATIRLGKGGPNLEWRRGKLWTCDLADNAEIQFVAWSY